jgi:hypothetical protein
MIEPYGHLHMTLDGMAIQTTVDEQMAGWMPWVATGEQVRIRAEIDIRPIVPPWENGSTSDEARHILSTQEEGYLLGYPWRFEQLCTATGTITVGDETHTLNGHANRIRRQSIRRLASLWGHVWQAAVFPSGRAFGYQVYPPRADGKATYNEAYIHDGNGRIIPARVVEAPFLRTIQASGQDVSCVLETDDGTVEIAGETQMSTFMVMPPEIAGGLQLQQALTRYTWNGETATGMLERSSLPDQIAR